MALAVMIAFFRALGTDLGAVFQKQFCKFAVALQEFAREGAIFGAVRAHTDAARHGFGVAV
ncbi:hypothetical protein, partial [Providencia stuartii]|uniref:hypothetical protein n=1 Tax=Providencia stuartii TaxID=588 RepID=UPI001EF889B9